jgi:hypothetical protein
VREWSITSRIAGVALVGPGHCRVTETVGGRNTLAPRTRTLPAYSNGPMVRAEFVDEAPGRQKWGKRAKDRAR